MRRKPPDWFISSHMQGVRGGMEDRGREWASARRRRLERMRKGMVPVGRRPRQPTLDPPTLYDVVANMAAQIDMETTAQQMFIQNVQAILAGEVAFVGLANNRRRQVVATMSGAAVVSASGQRSISPWLAFELDPASLVSHKNPIFTLWHSNGPLNRVRADNTEIILPAGTDALGGQYNVSGTLARLVEAVKAPTSTFGGEKTQSRIVVPPHPSTNTAEDDAEIEQRWARNAGILSMAIEPLSTVTTTTQFLNYPVCLRGTQQLRAADPTKGEFYSQLNLDCASLGVTAGVALANATVSGFNPSYYYTPCGTHVIGAFDPGIKGPTWVQGIFNRYAALGVTNICFAPMHNSGASAFRADFDAFVTFMGWNGTKSWAFSWAVNYPTQVLQQGNNVSYVRARGHRAGFLIKPQQTRFRDDEGWYYENNPVLSIYTGGEYACTNKLDGDALFLVTWNDLNEATEFCPGTSTQWACLDMIAYYNAWFRSGTRPTIVRDAIYYAHRVHHLGTQPEPFYGEALHNNAPGGSPDKDLIYVMAMLVDDADIDIITANGTTTHTGVAGGTPQVVTAALPTFGGYPRFVVRRNGQTIIDLTSAFEVWTKLPCWQDTVYRCGGSLRAIDLPAQGWTHPYIEPVQVVRWWPKGAARYGRGRSASINMTAQLYQNTTMVRV